MYSRTVLMAISAFLGLVNATNILLSNDDGWFDTNIRTLYDYLTQKGYNTLMSAPATDQTGKGTKDWTPTPLKKDGCQYASCPPYSAPCGQDSQFPQIWYVNAPPVTAVSWGLENLTPEFFNDTGGRPDLVVSGVNQGENTGITNVLSGTVGAAITGMRAGIPSIAFSSLLRKKWPGTDPQHPAPRLYAELATEFVTKLVSSGKPCLPKNTFLNINFPNISRQCSRAEDFHWVFTRMHYDFFWTDDDAEWCGNDRLPREGHVVDNNEHCYITVTLAHSPNGHRSTTAEAWQQEIFLEKMGWFLDCYQD